MPTKRIFISAGEASGDLHGSNLVGAVLEIMPDTKFFGLGGPRMKEAGVEVGFDSNSLSVMGTVEVFRKLGLIRKALAWSKDLLRDEAPDLVVLIDFPDFNIRLAREAKRLNIPVLYYIGPQVWAWREARAAKLKKFVDRMALILPFESAWYKDHDMDVTFVGHPFMDEVRVRLNREEVYEKFGLDPKKRTVAIMPGSRYQEIRRILPSMLKSVELLSSNHGDLQFVLILAPGIESEWIKPITSKCEVKVNVADDFIYDVMNISCLSLVASGSATLVLAILGVPMVIVYRTSFFTYLVAKAMVKIKSIGLINIVAGDRIVPELIQGDATPLNLAKEAGKFLSDEDYRERVIEKLRMARERLGAPGASRRTAEMVVEMLR